MVYLTDKNGNGTEMADGPIPGRTLETEIEVTPAMIAAGEEAWRIFDRDDPLEWKLVVSFRAMEAARL